MNSEDGILHACTIDGDGSGVSLVGQAITDKVKHTDLAWVHLDVNHPQARQWIQKEISYLDEIIIDALLAAETRPRILEFEHGLLMILRGVNLNKSAEPEDMISIRLWVDEHRIISTQRRPLKAIEDIRSQLKNGKGPKNPGDFIAMLSARLFERMEPILTELDERTDNAEETIMEEPDISKREEIISIRKKAIMLRRYIAPQRDVITYLRTSEIDWLDKDHRRRLQESLDRVIRYIEDLDMIRERAQIIKDELANALSDKLNKNLYILSVVAAIFLPLGFLTGLLGINVAGIPGSENPHAFIIFIGMLIGIVLFQVVLFKKLKWF